MSALKTCPHVCSSFACLCTSLQVHCTAKGCTSAIGHADKIHQKHILFTMKFDDFPRRGEATHNERWSDKTMRGEVNLADTSSANIPTKPFRRLTWNNHSARTAIAVQRNQLFRKDHVDHGHPKCMQTSEYPNEIESIKMTTRMNNSTPDSTCELWESITWPQGAPGNYEECCWNTSSNSRQVVVVVVEVVGK